MTSGFTIALCAVFSALPIEDSCFATGEHYRTLAECVQHEGGTLNPDRICVEDRTAAKFRQLWEIPPKKHHGGCVVQNPAEPCPCDWCQL